MIREATTADIPRILDMVEALVDAVQGPQRVDRAHAGKTIAGLIASPDGAVWVSDGGFLAASLTWSTISPDPIAVEHGWFAADRSGLRLLKAFEAWAIERGATRAVLSTGPQGPDLSNLGYTATEVAWVK